MTTLSNCPPVQTPQRRSVLTAPAGLLAVTAAAVLACCSGSVPVLAAGLSTPPALSGQLVSVSTGHLTILARGSQSTIGTTASTHYYQAVAATNKLLARGQSVAISTGRATAGTAASVTILPASGAPVAYVRQRGGFGGGFGGGGGDGGGGDGGGGGGRVGGTVALGTATAPTGKITAISGTSVTIAETGGAKTTITLTASTRVFRLAAIHRSQLHPGSFVAMRAGFGGSTMLAADVVEAGSGMSVTLGSGLGGLSVPGNG